LSRRTFVKESIIRAAPERVFAFHELPDALARLARNSTPLTPAKFSNTSNAFGVRPVHLETVADGEPHVMHYNGEEHEED
jgi:ligand-binding SRPBCC domain-containing protein